MISNGVKKKISEYGFFWDEYTRLMGGEKRARKSNGVENGKHIVTNYFCSKYKSTN